MIQYRNAQGLHKLTVVPRATLLDSQDVQNSLNKRGAAMAEASGNRSSSNSRQATLYTASNGVLLT